MTQLRKDIRNNWAAEDNVELENDRVLEIRTMKGSDGTIVTRATVNVRDGSFMSHRMFRDFSQRLMTSQNRCTEKNVVTQHSEALNKREELLEAITAWYKEKEPA